jgi:methionine-rich copper-binding protein CopC
MLRILKITSLAFAGVVAATAASAHAFLDHAVPGVGTSVAAAPGELQLTFTENVVLAFSGVSLKSASGKTIPVGKLVAGPANTLHVRIGAKLPPGGYTVSWHVVSVDTHHTQGDYHFTIAP